MDNLVSEITEGIENFSRERQTYPPPNAERQEYVLSELHRLQKGIPVLNKDATQNRRNREYKNKIHQLDTQLDEEIEAWENINYETNIPSDASTITTTTEPQTTTPTIVHKTSSPSIEHNISSPPFIEPKTSSPSVEHKTSSPSVEHKTSSPSIEHKTSSPSIEHKTSSPFIEHKTSSSSIEHKTSSSSIKHKTSSSSIEHKTSSSSIEHKTSAPYIEHRTSDLERFKQKPISKPPVELGSYWSNLFIELDLDERGYYLSLYDRGFNKRYEKASTEKDSMPFIIGLIGDTHVGKSAMIEPILKSLTEKEMLDMIDSNEDNDIKNDNDKKFQGSTANVALFSSDKLDGVSNTKIYLLDMEGTSANNTPSILEQGLSWLLKETPNGVLRNKLQKMISDPIKRNTAVNQLIPPLAYLICDMLIFISTDTFDNESYIQRVSKFTKSIHIQASDRPALVLISNKVNVVGSVFEDCTKVFFSLETKDEIDRSVPVETFLKAWYSSINCICLPNWNESRINKNNMRSLSQATVEMIGAIKFIEQISKLKKIIASEIQNRKELRNKFGQHLSEKTLLATLKHFLRHQFNNFDQTKRLLDYYNFTISNVSGEVNLVFRVFEMLQQKINKACDDPDNVLENLNKIYLFSMIFLAIHISFRVRSQIETKQHMAEIPANWKTEALQLIELLQKSQLCFSTVTYRLPDRHLEVKKTFRCTQENRVHLQEHFSNEQLFTPDASSSYIEKWFITLKSFFGIGYYPRWRGEFSNHPKVKTSKDLENIFEEAIRKVFEKNTIEECKYYAVELMKSLTDADPIDVYINEEDNCDCISYCSICFDKGTKKLCEKCIEVWDKVEILKEWKLK